LYTPGKHTGEVEISALVEGEWSTSCPGGLILGERHPVLIE